MNLGVIGKFDLDTLEKWVTDKFSPVKNYDVVLPNIGEPKPYPVSHLSKFIKFVPIKDEDVLSLVYLLPYC